MHIKISLDSWLSNGLETIASAVGILAPIVLIAIGFLSSK